MKGLVKPSANMCGNVDIDLPTEADATKKPERKNQDPKYPKRTNFPGHRDRDAPHHEDPRDRDQAQQRDRTFSQRKRRSASRNRPAKREEVYYQKKGEEGEVCFF